MLQFFKTIVLFEINIFIIKKILIFAIVTSNFILKVLNHDAKYLIIICKTYYLNKNIRILKI